MPELQIGPGSAARIGDLVVGAMGASASFPTPFANGVGIMVYRLGGYRFGEFWRLVLLVQAWTLIVTMVIVPPDSARQGRWPSS
ncbi:hypothetical protein [Catellatospora citrea]|uniref:Uncharacterized protein n=2 Tax=Catellatospora citrea TaxID=53366 RepID=A0A8J3K512_9ACTN|nr:hypothetical protein [Catellatospora citrea]GIF96846.1 hypothetical protein Cci01nite_19400 [Catellatospora citrea]